VNRVPIPTHVGDLRWPVQAAVRVHPERDNAHPGPAEFSVVVDCGDSTPTHPYAVLTVYVWADRVVADRGHYDLTFARAQQIMLERAGLLPTPTVEVVTVRDRDHANEHTIFVDGTRRDTTVTDTGLQDTRTPGTASGPDGTDDTGVAGRARVVVCDIDPGDTGATPAWVRDMLTRAAKLSPAAAAWATVTVVDFVDGGMPPP
jgi:hypothetical protein